MKIMTLKDVLLSRNEIERYYEGHVPVNLWRALNIRRQAALFELIESDMLLKNGRPRPADITIVQVGGMKWVHISKQPRGISTFDKLGAPSGPDWEYFRIPAGTELPQGLAVVKDKFSTTMGATHYTIAPSHDMPLEQFKMLLTKLAAKVIKETA